MITVVGLSCRLLPYTSMELGRPTRVSRLLDIRRVNLAP
jgi:hypothetical protein